MSLPTPNISHFTESDYEHIYEPAGKVARSLSQLDTGDDPVLEDSFILLDALELDAQDLRRMNPSVCVEIGSAVSKLSLILEGTGALTDLLLEFLKSWFWSRFSVHVQFARSRK